MRRLVEVFFCHRRRTDSGGTCCARCRCCSSFRSSLWPNDINFKFTAFVYPVLVALLLFGPQDRAHNFGLNLFWCYWWPIMFVVYPFLGRVWCAGELQLCLRRYYHMLFAHQVSTQKCNVGGYCFCGRQSAEGHSAGSQQQCNAHEAHLRSKGYFRGVGTHDG